jgi:hypothetical protein
MTVLDELSPSVWGVKPVAFWSVALYVHASIRGESEGKAQSLLTSVSDARDKARTCSLFTGKNN